MAGQVFADPGVRKCRSLNSVVTHDRLALGFRLTLGRTLLFIQTDSLTLSLPILSTRCAIRCATSSDKSARKYAYFSGGLIRQIIYQRGFAGDSVRTLLRGNIRLYRADYRWCLGLRCHAIQTVLRRTSKPAGKPWHPVL